MEKKHHILAALALIFCHLALNAQTHSYVHVADSLHASYDFDGAIGAYQSVLSKLHPSIDSLLIGEIREKMVHSENGKNMSLFVQKPKVVAKQKFSADDFFLYYPLEDRSWRPLPNTLDTLPPKGPVKALYAPEWDKKIFYSASGESGTRDILMTEIADTVWSFPVVQMDISTDLSNEIYPLLSPDGKTIYFSSDGFYGVGGYDLYRSDWDEKAKRWSAPQNMGFPYSSPADDLMYMETEDGEFVLFASNRECSKDSMIVYVIEKEPYPVHTPISDAAELFQLSRLELPIVEKVEESDEQEIPENDLTVRYREKMTQVKALRDSISVSLDALESMRNEYIQNDDSEVREKLTTDILKLETDIPVMQKQLDVANRELIDIEMEFLKEGIFISMDMSEDDDVEEENVSVVDYKFTQLYMGNPLNINFIVPEIKFDYSFRVEEEAVFAEDQNIPTEGVVYQIQLFSGGRKATVKELKGLCPIYEHRSPSGMYTYRVGLFTSYEEVSKHLGLVRSKGFNDAYIAAFVDAETVSVVRARTVESEVKQEPVFYEVRIIPESGELTNEVMTGMMEYAEGKDIARVEMEDGTLVFRVGPFDDRTKAEELVLYLQGVVSGLVSCDMSGSEIKY